MTKEKFFRMFLALALVFSACGKEVEEIDPPEEEQEQSVEPYFINNPLPKNPETLKILGIGHSFTNDGMHYLPNLLSSAGIHNVTLGKMWIPGCSLEGHYQAYVRNTADYTYDKSAAGATVWSAPPVMVTFTQGVSDENWDVIIIQQSPQDAGIYETYQPYLNDLIDIIRDNCTNSDVALGWQMTWAYSTNSTYIGFANYNNSPMYMYQSIVDAVKTMIEETGIDIIVPSATAIQNLRGTSLNNPPLDLTRDGYHADYGAGRYTLACTWFQALIAPCLEKTIEGNPWRVNNGNVFVTNGNYLVCQKAAQYACSNSFEISTFSYETFDVTVPDPELVNIVLNKPVTHSSFYLNPGQGAVDGDKTDGRWVSGASGPEHWIEIDLQGSYTIVAYALWRNLTSGTGMLMPQFSLQAWIDDAWVTVSSEENNTTDNPYYREFNAVTTNRVRWYVPAYLNNVVRLYEIEVYGVANE